MACSIVEDGQDQMDVAVFRRLLEQLSAAYEGLHRRVEQCRERELKYNLSRTEMNGSCDRLVSPDVSPGVSPDISAEESTGVSWKNSSVCILESPELVVAGGFFPTQATMSPIDSTGDPDAPTSSQTLRFRRPSISSLSSVRAPSSDCRISRRFSMTRRGTSGRREVCWANLVLLLMEQRKRPTMRLFWEEDVLGLSVFSPCRLNESDQNDEDDEEGDAVLQAWRCREGATEARSMTLLHATAATAGSRAGGRRMSYKFSGQFAPIAPPRKWSIEDLVISPLSWRKSAWMGFGVTMIFIDFMLLTLGIFGLDMQSPLAKGFEVFAGVFWVCDIIVTFFTAVYHHQHIVTNLRVIAHHYVTRWFVFDCSMVILQWVIFIIEMGSTSKVKMLKYIKLAKYVRLLRLAKVEELVVKALEQVNSGHLLAVFRMVGHLAMVMLFVHCSATGWYWSGRQLDGPSWAVDAAGNPWNDSFPLNYFMALYWAVSQFQGSCDIYPGRSAAERAVACLFVFASVVVLALLLSKLAALTHQMSEMKAAKEQYINTARVYLDAHKISTQLSMRVRRYVQWMQIYSANNTHGDEVLQILPFDLRCELLEETRLPIVHTHCALAAVQCVHKCTWQRLICEGLSPATYLSGDFVFSYGKACEKMGFVVSGGVKYFRYPVVLQSVLKFCGRTKLGGASRIPMITHDLVDNMRNSHALMLIAGGSFCEAALWVDWRHCGDMGAVDKVSMLMLSVADFDLAMQLDPSTKAYFEANAQRWAAVLNDESQEHANDMTTSAGIIELSARRAEEDDFYED